MEAGYGATNPTTTPGSPVKGSGDPRIAAAKQAASRKQR